MAWLSPKCPFGIVHGRRAECHFQSTIAYTYDPAGRLTGVSDNSSSITSLATPGAPLAYTTSYTYDALNRPTGITFGDVPAVAAPGTSSSVVFQHVYNAVNQRTGQTASDNAWIDYPAAAASTAYTANNLNQYTAVGAASPTYDGNANLTSDGTLTLGYDAENRLVSASKNGLTAAYAYDGRGRRKSRTVNGTTTITVTDADNREVLEYDGSTGALLRWYAYGLGPNDVLGQMTVGGGRLSLVPDIQGSIVATLDASSGTLSPFGYRPYGGSGSTPAEFAYTGQRLDAETGLYYYRARHYHAAWGRFPQTDPVGYLDGPNLYAYVGNDPLNFADPFGLNAEGATTNDRTFFERVGNSIIAFAGLFSWGTVDDPRSGRLTYEWVTGTGPERYAFGPSSQNTIEMQYAPGVSAAREALYRETNGIPQEGMYGPYSASFGGSGYLNARTPAEHFVGGYVVEVRVSDGQAHFTITNRSSFGSFTAESLTGKPFGLERSWERSQFPYMGNTRQTYSWSEPLRGRP